MEEIFEDGFGGFHSNKRTPGSVTFKAALGTVMRDVLPRLNVRRRQLFGYTPFGQLADVDEPHGDPSLVHAMMMHEIRSPHLIEEKRFGFDLLSFQVEFGDREFCLITGFRFGAYSDILAGKCIPANSALRQRLFPAYSDRGLRIKHLREYILSESTKLFSHSVM
ncbi:hypothetical protein LXL04_027958 [Taraxacum kok-saghyz]